MQIEILKQLESKLPRGGKTEISRKANVSIFTVMRFFNGVSRNKKVLTATNEYFKELNTNTDELTKAIN